MKCTLWDVKDETVADWENEFCHSFASFSIAQYRLSKQNSSLLSFQGTKCCLHFSKVPIQISMDQPEILKTSMNYPKKPEIKQILLHSHLSAFCSNFFLWLLLLVPEFLRELWYQLISENIVQSRQDTLSTVLSVG